jgi:dipeptidyl aminopeptidase/acylaminoacyl peptidase
MSVRGLTVHYKVVLPNGSDPVKTYAGIIALGGGPQTMNTSRGSRLTALRRIRGGPQGVQFVIADTNA